MGFLSNLFISKTKKIKDFKDRKAVIVDVRTTAEYQRSAIPGSKNIPLQQLNKQIGEIKKWNKPVITCCASGIRSASAAGILRSHGIEALNSGGYMKLHKRLES